jgi:hypothetical protein
MQISTNQTLDEEVQVLPPEQSTISGIKRKRGGKQDVDRIIIKGCKTGLLNH